MKLFHWLVIAALGLLSACVSVRSSTAPGTDLMHYRTFAWAQPTDPSVARMERSPAGQTVRNEIVRNLNARGIEEAQQGRAPDFLVAYHVVLRDRLDVTDWGWGWWGTWGGADVYQYTQGTIIVDFIDPRTNAVFWRGSASRDVDTPENPDLGDVASAVDKLMKTYPVRVASAGARPSG